MQIGATSSADGAGEASASHAGLKTWAGRILLLLVTLFSLALLYRTLSRYDFDELMASIAAVPLGRLAIAVAWAAASYTCLGVNDWLALFYARHPLRYRTAALTSFVALGLGHSIGFAALSSGAIRYRFYSRLGLGAEELAKIVVFCGSTIMLGMMILGVLAIFMRPDLAQRLTQLSGGEVFAIGGALALIPAAYLLLAIFVRRRFHLYRWSIEVPRPSLAIAQMGVGTLNFICVAACLYTVASAVADVSYFDVLAAFVLANTATMITHAPGGLGVIETVVMLVLRRPELIGAVLVFRFVYFLLPLSLAATLFVVTEALWRRASRGGKRPGSAGGVRAAGREQGREPHRTARVEQPRPEYQVGRSPM